MQRFPDAASKPFLAFSVAQRGRVIFERQASPRCFGQWRSDHMRQFPVNSPDQSLENISAVSSIVVGHLCPLDDAAYWFPERNLGQHHALFPKC